MQQKQETNGIQIFSQEASDRLKILQTLSDGVIGSIKVMETIANKLDGFKAEIHIKDCNFKSGDISGNMIGLNNANNSMITNCYMVSGQKEVIKPDECISEEEVDNNDTDDAEEVSCCSDCQHNERSIRMCGSQSCVSCECNDCGAGCISGDERFYVSDKQRYTKKIEE